LISYKEGRGQKLGLCPCYSGIKGESLPAGLSVIDIQDQQEHPVIWGCFGGRGGRIGRIRRPGATLSGVVCGHTIALQRSDEGLCQPGGLCRDKEKRLGLRVDPKCSQPGFCLWLPRGGAVKASPQGSEHGGKPTGWEIINDPELNGGLWVINGGGSPQNRGHSNQKTGTGSAECGSLTPWVGDP